MLCGAAFSLATINLYAYYKCRKDYQGKLQAAMGGISMGGAILGQFTKKLGF